MRNIVRRIYRSMKMFYYRRRYRLRNVDKTFYMGGKSLISSDLVAEEYVYIGSGCHIYPNVKIGKYTMLAPQVKIVGGDHYYKNYQKPIIFSGRDVSETTTIGRDVWIGYGAFIKSGVTIGDGSIIAAYSVVVKDIPPYSLFGGNPAKFIKNRFSEKEKNIHIEMLNKKPTDLNFGFNDLN